MTRRLTMLLLALFPLLQGQAQTRVQPAAPSSGEREASGMASTYMPIESWVYSAVDRLTAAGYIQTAFVGLRPWTRMDFARLIVEVS